MFEQVEDGVQGGQPVGFGATLVRPDGYIAWRAVTAPADPARALTTALAAVSQAVGVATRSAWGQRDARRQAAAPSSRAEGLQRPVGPA